MASFPPSRPSTSGQSGKEKEIGYKEVGIDEKITPLRQQNQGSDINPMVEHKSSIYSSVATQGERTYHSGNAYVSGDVNAAFAMSNISVEKDNALMSADAENYHTNMELIVGARSNGPQIRERDPSYVANVNRNKKQKIACEFYGKGWCIRGKSCSFLHSDEGLDTFNNTASSSKSIPPQQCGYDHKLRHQNEPFVLKTVDVLGKTPLLVGRSSLHNLCTASCSIGGQQSLLDISLRHHLSGSSCLHQRTSMDSGSNISTNDWEPSVPFVPSHDITEKILMKEHLHDPLHESFLQTVLKDRPLRPVRFTFSCQGTPAKSDTQIQLGQRSGLNVDGSSNGNGGVADLPGRKALKEFESALILHVKGLLEPAWLSGHVTKDNFKMIVQKSVEKVVKSFHPTHIPNSSESIKLYISSSQAKLEKLVQDYLKMYRKS